MVLLALSISACGGGGDKAAEEARASPTPNPETYAGKLLGGLDRTAIERTRNDMMSVRTALTSFAAQEGELPRLASMAELEGKLSPAYIRRLPRTDAWGNEMQFSTDGNTWKLVAPGGDGVAGTSDDLVMTDEGVVQLPAGYNQP